MFGEVRGFRSCARSAAASSADSAERDFVEHILPQIISAARISGMAHQVDPDDLVSSAAAALWASDGAVATLLGVGSKKEQVRYVYWVVENAARDAARRRARGRGEESSEVLAHVAHPQQDQLEQVLEGELRERLRAAIEELPPEAARIVKFRFFDDMPIRVISEHEGLS